MNSAYFKDSLKMIKPTAAKVQNAVMRSQLDDVFTLAEKAVNDYQQAADRIRADRNLTAEGKHEVRQQITVDTRARLAELKQPLDRYQAKVKEIEQEARKVAEPENPVLEYLRQREIRDRLGNDAALEQRYRLAVESGQDLQLADALENSPVPYDFVDDSTRQKTLMHKLALTAPEKVSALKDISLFSQVVTGTIDSAETVINAQ